MILNSIFENNKNYDKIIKEIKKLIKIIRWSNMNKVTVFYTKYTNNILEYAKYAAQICGPSKLYPLEENEIINIKKIPKYLIFCITIFYYSEENNNESDILNIDESISKKIKKLISKYYFMEKDISTIQTMINSIILNDEKEIYFLFIKEKVKDNSIKNLTSSDNFIQTINSLNMFIKGYSIFDSESKEEIDNLIDYLRKIRIQTLNPKKEMSQSELSSIILQFILNHDVCVLSTGYKENIRATVLEYIFKNFKFYIISEAGEKYANLACNRKVALTIFDSISQTGRTKSIQVEGISNIYCCNDEKIRYILQARGLNEEIIKSLNFEIFIIEIEPLSIELYDPSFKEIGYSNRQIFNPINFI